jgi:tetratricopeptide (TPR) repeat protein
MKGKLIFVATVCVLIAVSILTIQYVCGLIDDVNEASDFVHETMSPDHIAAHKLLLEGRVLASQGKYGDAMLTLERSHAIVNKEIIDTRHALISKKSEMPLVAAQFDALGYCYFKLRRYAEAEKELSWAISCKPDYGPFYLARAMVYDHRGKIDLAAADRKKADAVTAEPHQTQPRNFTSMFSDELSKALPQKNLLHR